MKIKFLCLSHVSLAIFLMSPSVYAAEDADGDRAPPEELRYAALECQNESVFVIVNFYPRQIYKLSWGRDDVLLVADQLVSRYVQGDTEIFRNNKVEISLPVAYGADSIRERKGHFVNLSPSRQEWRGLRCLLHGAD